MHQGQPVRRDGVVAPAARFAAGPGEVVVTAAQRAAVGLDHWMDGAMGIARHGGRTVALAPNGARTARHDLGAGGFVAGLEDAHQELARPREHHDHASGGALHVDDETGALWLSYHAERFTGGDPSDYWSSIGFAVGDPDGRELRDLGMVVSSDMAEHREPRMRPVEVGPGSFVVHDGQVHLYFTDRSTLDTRANLGVARCSLDEVRRAVAEDRAPRFSKYFAGSFREPGLGGRATDLLPHATHRTIWFDVAYVVPLGCYLLVASVVTDMVRRRARWAHVCRTSPDGLRWSAPQVLHRGEYGEELIYLSLDSGTTHQRRIEGDGLDLYRVSSRAAFRWDDAHLERCRVTWTPTQTPAPTTA